MTQGLILFAHGARDPRWAVPFEDMAARISARRPQLALRLAYLEFMAPDLPGAAADLVAAGCRRIELLPMFLGSGGHVRKDLPRLLDDLRQRHGGIRFGLHTAIGEMDTVLQAMADAAIDLVDAIPPEATAEVKA
jgi:sirohydrochlorin cobaltochelatase